MTRNLKQALFSALLVWAVAYPVLGLKLTIVGINLEVHGTSNATLITIAVCSVLMFLRVLFDQQISSAWKSSPNLPVMPAKASTFLTLPTTQRWIIIALIMTKSPTVLVPALTPQAHSTITAPRPAVKIAAWPLLSTASDT